jgi:hypothetical protein
MTALRSRIHSQFGHPAGVLGGLAGVVMASRGSNRQRNAWTVRQLDIQPTDRVLEIGFGPRLAQVNTLTQGVRAGQRAHYSPRAPSGSAGAPVASA